MWLPWYWGHFKIRGQQGQAGAGVEEPGTRALVTTAVVTIGAGWKTTLLPQRLLKIYQHFQGSEYLATGHCRYIALKWPHTSKEVANVIVCQYKLHKTATQ